MSETYNCEPTLNDTQVLEFCKYGFLVLEAVVSDEVNKKTVQFMEEQVERLGHTKDKVGYGSGVDDMLNESWFMNSVIKNPAAAGAVRSLLGKNFGLPNRISSHRPVCPQPAQEWHMDGCSIFGPVLDYLQVFYYPEDCPKELGPTEVLPGSHHFFSLQTHMAQYGRIKGSKLVEAPAGSICITTYPIWHRRSESTGTGARNNIKYNYWRMVNPERDWIIEPEFDLATADFNVNLPIYTGGDQPSQRARLGTSEMLCWLWGKSEYFTFKGGQSWPVDRADPGIIPYGVPAGLINE